MLKKKLENELTWSITRAQLFQSCPRAYYYNYYGSWGGWEREADADTRLIYILKNIKPMLVWAGTIVHNTIREALTTVASGGSRPDKGQLEQAAILKMRQEWTESVRKEWLDKPSKKTNLFELYYRDGENYGECHSLPREETDAIKERVINCIDAFTYSQALNNILNTPPSNWKTIDKLDSFQLDGIKVWCALDFAFVDTNGILNIYDWKTGGENKATLRQQLACYALYAQNVWNTPVNMLSLNGVFLNDGGRLSPYPVKQELLDSVTAQIKASFQAMKKCLASPENNLAKIDDFQCTPSEFTCARCNFRRICPAIH